MSPGTQAPARAVARMQVNTALQVLSLRRSPGGKPTSPALGSRCTAVPSLNPEAPQPCILKTLRFLLLPAEPQDSFQLSPPSLKDYKKMEQKALRKEALEYSVMFYRLLDKRILSTESIKTLKNSTGTLLGYRRRVVPLFLK